MTCEGGETGKTIQLTTDQKEHACHDSDAVVKGGRVG